MSYIKEREEGSNRRSFNLHILLEENLFNLVKKKNSLSFLKTQKSSKNKGSDCL